MAVYDYLTVGEVKPEPLSYEEHVRKWDPLAALTASNYGHVSSLCKARISASVRQAYLWRTLGYSWLKDQLQARYVVMKISHLLGVEQKVSLWVSLAWLLSLSRQS